MRRLIHVLLFGVIFGSPAIQAETLRCGTQLVSTGDRTFEVERKCGAPSQRDFVGYTLGPNVRQEMVVEEWLYGPTNGKLSILTFQGNRLIRIEFRRAR